MKKGIQVISIVLCLAMFAVLALGSGSSSNEEKKELSSTSSTSNTGSSEKNKITVSIEEQILLENNGIKITAKEYTNDSIWGDGIKLLIENNGSKDLTIGCDALIVNDYMIPDLFAETVAAGKKANAMLYISSSELNAAGITTVGKIEVYFHAFDNDWKEVFGNQYVEIKTSEYANMDTTANDTGTELYNSNGIKIIGKTVDENSFWGTAILLYVENNSGKNVGVSVEDLSINGFMINPWFSSTVYEGKKAIDDITILSSELEDNGITSIDEVELKFRIYDVNTFNQIDETDAITFSAK